ncbi:MAG: glucose 1-dehydrogenase [Chloroflexi bacterium]|nr:glucose 1-dehydrogenase [Chloroflexota bacterium]
MVIADRVAVVTGSGRGIGRAIALALAGAGAHLVVNAARSRPEMEAVAAEVRALGRQAIAVQADVSDPVQVKALLQACLTHFGRVDVWVNNAGADILTEVTAATTPEEKLDRVLAVDVKGTYYCSKAVAPVMRAQGHGCIINVSWDHVVEGMAGENPEIYAVAKGAILAFSKCLARSLAPTVRLNVLAPGWVKTRFGDTLPAERLRAVAAATPLDRWGTPEDIARAAVFLASDDASFITGQTLMVNGGIVMH